MDEVNFRRRSNRGSQNLRAGYVPVDDEYLQQTGIRGKRSCCLAALVIVLLLVAVINALVTAGLVYFMGITHLGMGVFEFLPGGKLVRVLTDCEVGSVTTFAGTIGSRVDRDLEISGEQVVLNQTDGTAIKVDGSTIHVHSDEFQLKSGKGDVFFSLDSALRLPPHIGVNLHSSEVEVHTISSRDGYNGLYVESTHDLDLVGNMGVSMASEGEITLHNTNNIVINPVDGLLVLEGSEGIEINPKQPSAGKGSIRPGSPKGYKLCVCRTTGEVFAVPVVDANSGCHKLNEDLNPCET